MTQKFESVQNIFNDDDDDSMGSLSDVHEFCTNLTSLSMNEPHAYTDERNAIDNDALTSQSFTFPKNSAVACILTESGITMQSSMDDIEDVEDVENVQDIEDVEDVNDVEDVQDIEDVEDVENVEDIENIALHVDGNIDAGRLCSVQISGRCFVDFGHVYAELQRLSAHWINECRFTDLVITQVQRFGLKIKFFVKCRMCHFKNSFWSEPTDDRKFDVNRGIVAGTILTGTGHKQLEELLAAVDA